MLISIDEEGHHGTPTSADSGADQSGPVDAEEFEDYLEARDPEVVPRIRKSHESMWTAKFGPPNRFFVSPRGAGPRRVSLENDSGVPRPRHARL